MIRINIVNNDLGSDARRRVQPAHERLQRHERETRSSTQGDIVEFIFS